MDLHRMTWVEAREALHTARVGLLPVGSTEQHGPHLPLGTDHLTAAEVARRASTRGGWIVLPTVSVGISEHHRQFWGTLWVEPNVFRDYVLGIARSLASHGVRRMVLVNGHGGNTPALDEAARKLRREDIFSYVFSWWRTIPDVIAETIDIDGSHAGELETSAMLAVARELVVSDRYSDAAATSAPEWGKRLHGVEVGFDTRDFSPNGAVGDPSHATAEKGERLLSAAADRLNLFCRWLAEEPEGKLRTQPHLS